MGIPGGSSPCQPNRKQNWKPFTASSASSSKASETTCPWRIPWKRSRTYQQDLEQLRAEIRPALDEIERGEASELDYDALKERVAKRLADEGITD